MDGALRLRLKGDSILHVMSADPDWLQREDWEVFFSDGVCAAVKKSGDLANPSIPRLRYVYKDAHVKILRGDALFI